MRNVTSHLSYILLIYLSAIDATSYYNFEKFSVGLIGQYLYNHIILKSTLHNDPSKYILGM